MTALPLKLLGLLALISAAAFALPPPPSHYAFFFFFIGIDDACAWQSLHALPGGRLSVFVFFFFFYVATEGAYECWISDDHGVRWKRASVPVPNEPGTNRMHVGGGVVEGKLVALVGGLTHRPPYAEGARFWEKNIEGSTNVPVLAAVSGDGGMTWKQSGDLNLPKRPRSQKNSTPFGRIVKLPDGNHGAFIYGEGVHFYITADGGMSWKQRGTLSPHRPDLEGGAVHNETNLVVLANGDLFAASRSYRSEAFLGAGGLDGFRSTDGGRTWTLEGPLALPDQYPADLTRLPNGKVLLTYASRNVGSRGIWIRFGSADAKAWSAPRLLVDLEGSFENQYEKSATDGGYPSTVLAADGNVVTVYYSRGVPAHQRYHMGVVRWRLPQWP